METYTASDGSKWKVLEVTPPIPSREFDWAYVADDYDGATDAKDPRCGYVATREAAIAEIEEYILEQKTA